MQDYVDSFISIQSGSRCRRQGRRTLLTGATRLLSHTELRTLTAQPPWIAFPFEVE
jgi:hypothetical protein